MSQNIEQGQRQNSGQPVAFHGSVEAKNKAFQLIRDARHGKYDKQLEQGDYYDNTGEKTQVCAVGTYLGQLAVAEDRYKLLGFHLGIPAWLTRVYEGTFETHRYPEDAKDFAVDFIASIPVGFNDWDDLFEETVKNAYDNYKAWNYIRDVDGKSDTVKAISGRIDRDEVVKLGQQIIDYFARQTGD